MSIISKKIGRNLIGYGYSQIVTLAAQIVVVPFFLAAWGVQQYGEWLVITGALMFLSLMELGVAQASATRATLAAGAGDIKAVRVSLDTAMAFSLIAAVVVVTMAGLLSWLLPWSELLRLSSISNTQAGLVFLAMSGCLASGFIVGAVAAWLKAVDKTALSAFLIAHRRAIEIVATAIALMLSASPLQLAITLLLASIATMLACYAWAAKLSTIGLVNLRNACWSEFHTVFRPALAYMAYPIAQTITLQGGVQIMNHLTDAYTVVAFTMARTMARLILQVGMVFSNAIRPEVSRLMGQGNDVQAAKVIWRGTAYASGLAIVGLLGMTSLGPEIIKLWSSGKVTLSSSFLLILALHAAINVFWHVPATYMFATNKHALISWTYMLISALVLLGWWAVAAINALLEAALAMLITETLIAIIVSIKIYKLITNTKSYNFTQSLNHKSAK